MDGRRRTRDDQTADPLPWQDADRVRWRIAGWPHRICSDRSRDRSAATDWLVTGGPAVFGRRYRRTRSGLFASRSDVDGAWRAAFVLRSALERGGHWRLSAAGGVVPGSVGSPRSACAAFMATWTIRSWCGSRTNHGGAGYLFAPVVQRPDAAQGRIWCARPSGYPASAAGRRWYRPNARA